MKKQTKWIVGVVAVVLIATGAIVFSNTGLMKGSTQRFKPKLVVPAKKVAVQRLPDLVFALNGFSVERGLAKSRIGTDANCHAIHTFTGGAIINS